MALTIRRRDHPRVCGEHRLGAHHPVPRPGSSPRVRGTPAHGNRAIGGCRIIPACAGNTAWPAVSRGRFMGSSPRVRGTRNLFFRLFFSRDHPRVCGEHEMALTDEDIMRGSSPRVRGTPELRYKYEVNGGIIPACAGNTSTTRERRCRPRDHPRVCGEHSLAAYTITLNPGSSPRVRGTPELRYKYEVNGGIIPACAGNTSTTRERRCRPRDHPRVCGEHYKYDRDKRFAAGIIPACAGNTLRHLLGGITPRDHPRVCGEH